MSITPPPIMAQQLSQIFAQSRIPLIGVVAAALITLFLFWEPQRAHALLLWFSSLLLVSLGRYAIMFGYRRDLFREQHTKLWRRAYMLVEMMSGVLWASLLVAIFPSTDIEHLFSMLIIGSMMMLGLPVLYFVLPILAAYLFSLAFTTVGILLVLQQIYSHYLAIFTLAYTTALWLSARSNNIRNRQFIELSESLQLTNKQLVQHATKLQDAEQDAREAEARFRTLANATNEGVVLYENGRIVDVNDKVSSMLGYSREQLLEKNIEQLFVQSDQGLILELFGHNDGIPYELICISLEGNTFPVELMKKKFPLDGRKVYVFTLRDISELKHMAEIKDQFISTVSHELRTPITSIHASLGLLLGGVAGEVPKEFETLLNIAQQNSDRLNLLINDLLDMQKLDVGMLHFSYESVSLAELIKQSITLNQTFFEKYHTEVTAGACSTEILVHVDPNRFIQVMTNLLSNASKFSPAHSQVTVTTKQQGKLVQVHIRDQGPGIPEVFKDKLFQRFTQADASNTRQHGGSGLGLYICKQILHQMKADIDCVSSPEAGTTFTITLPVVTG